MSKTIFSLEQHIDQYMAHDIVINDNSTFESRSCDLYTDVGNFQIFMGYDSLKSELDK